MNFPLGLIQCNFQFSITDYIVKRRDSVGMSLKKKRGSVLKHHVSESDLSTDYSEGEDTIASSVNKDRILRTKVY